MNHSNSPSAANGHTPPPGTGLDDVLYTLFRHKWLILCFLCLGVLGEYVGRMHSDSMGRPTYVIRERTDVDAHPDITTEND